MLNLEIVEAAGEYWLYDTVQGPENLLKPIIVNSVGADIVNMVRKDLKKHEIIETICKEYEIDEKNASEDVNAFFSMLYNAGYHSILTYIG